MQVPAWLVVDEHTWLLGQPLPPVPRQPGWHLCAPGGSQMRPEVAAPQSASAMHPQASVGRQAEPFIVGSQLLVLPAVHSTQRSKLGPGVVSQTLPPTQSELMRHWTQVCALVSQTGAAPLQSVGNLQPGWQLPSIPPSATWQYWYMGQVSPIASTRHPMMQVPPAPIIRSQTSLGLPQSWSCPQPHAPAETMQTGLGAPQSVPLVDEHWVHAPARAPASAPSQAGVIGDFVVHSRSLWHARQALFTPQMGLVPPQSASVTHAVASACRTKNAASATSAAAPHLRPCLLMPRPIPRTALSDAERALSRPSSFTRRTFSHRIGFRLMHPDVILLATVACLARARIPATHAVLAEALGDAPVAAVSASLVRLRAAGLADERLGEARLTLAGLAVAVAQGGRSAGAGTRALRVRRLGARKRAA
jgi:hypothetical protein